MCILGLTVTQLHVAKDWFETQKGWLDASDWTNNATTPEISTYFTNQGCA